MKPGPHETQNCYSGVLYIILRSELIVESESFSFMITMSLLSGGPGFKSRLRQNSFLLSLFLHSAQKAKSAKIASALRELNYMVHLGGISVLNTYPHRDRHYRRMRNSGIWMNLTYGLWRRWNGAIKGGSGRMHDLCENRR